MIRCQKCGSTLPPNARFCSICGAESAPPAAPPPTLTSSQSNPTTVFAAQSGYASPSPEAENRKRTVIAVCGGAALATIAGLILAASGVFSAKKPEAGGAAVLSAPPAQTMQAPVLTAPAPQVSAAPVISAPPAQTNPMPEDVIAYLRWLKQFEAGRVALESKSEAQMMLVMQELIKVGMGGTASMRLLDGDSEAANKKPAQTSTIDTKAVNAVIGDWNTATGIFQAKNPPNPCATIASNYNAGMSGSVTAMTQILGAGVKAIDSINGAGGQKTGESGDVMTFLTDQKNNASISKNIEVSFANANQSLDALRSQYTGIPVDIDKAQFSIKTGNAGGINIPIPGMGM